MKNTFLSACFLLSLAGAVLGQDSQSPYARLTALSKKGMTDQSLRAFVASLSKGEFKRLVIEYRRENVPSPKVNVFGGMSMLSIPYYEDGAGKNDTYEEWAKDVQDRSYPSEWRDVILDHPPAKTRPQSAAQEHDYKTMLYDLVMSREEYPLVRRSALRKFSGLVKYDSLDPNQLGEYIACLKQIVTTPDQHPGFFQTALREIDHLIASGKETAAKSPDPALAKAIAGGDTAAITGDKKIPAEQQQFFTQVAELSKDFGAILGALSSQTNLPNYLQQEVKKLKGQNSATQSD